MTPKEIKRAIATSNDPQWVREQLGQPEQFSTRFLIVAYSVFALAGYGILAAIAHI